MTQQEIHRRRLELRTRRLLELQELSAPNWLIWNELVLVVQAGLGLFLFSDPPGEAQAIVAARESQGK